MSTPPLKAAIGVLSPSGSISHWVLQLHDKLADERARVGQRREAVQVEALLLPRPHEALDDPVALGLADIRRRDRGLAHGEDRRSLGSVPCVFLGHPPREGKIAPRGKARTLAANSGLCSEVMWVRSWAELAGSAISTPNDRGEQLG